MSFDRMGRRVQYLETAGATTNANNTFTYDNYVCITRYRAQNDGTVKTDRFIWDPTEPVATRPLVFHYATTPFAYYTHDGNKNVSELVRSNEDVVAHYEYEAFGAVCLETGDWGVENPWRFSSEYNDFMLGLVYYNYRHYEASNGRWLIRDPIYKPEYNEYLFIYNKLIKFDLIGLCESSCCGPDVSEWLTTEMLIIGSWINDVYNMIEVWAHEDSPWYEPDYIRAKAYRYAFLALLAKNMTYFPSTDFSKGFNVSDKCQNTVTLHGRCIHSSEIGNFLYGFASGMFGMTWLQTWGGSIVGNRGKRTDADAAGVEYGWDSVNDGWWYDKEFTYDTELAERMASDAPIDCAPSKCKANTGHISLPAVTKELNHLNLKSLIRVPNE